MMPLQSRFAALGFATITALTAHTAGADTLGAVEPIVDPAVLDIRPLAAQPLAVRAAFAERAQQCGVLDDVERVLARARATPTLAGREPRFSVAAGGFAGDTNPTYAFTAGRAAAQDELRVLSDGLGFVLSQGSVFLLDPDDTTHFDFPANYVVLEFRQTPPLARSAELFETVGDIDPALFETDTSGYTQFGRAYVSLQSDVPDAEFIAGYAAAAEQAGVRYTPIIDGRPALFAGGAAFPGNDWTAHPDGAEYLARLPAATHAALAGLREDHLRFTRRALAELGQRGSHPDALERMRHLTCR